MNVLKSIVMHTNDRYNKLIYAYNTNFKSFKF